MEECGELVGSGSGGGGGGGMEVGGVRGIVGDEVGSKLKWRFAPIDLS